MTRVRISQEPFDLNDLHLMVWVPCAAYFWLALGPTEGAGAGIRALEIVIAAGAGLLTSEVFWLTGYFNIVRVVPRKSDFLLLFFSMLISGCVAVIVHWLVLKTHPDAYGSILVSLPVFSVLLFLSYWLLARMVARTHKRRITLRMRRDEIEEFLQVLAEAELEEEVEVLSTGEVMAEFARRGHPNIDLIVVSRAGSRDMRTDRFLLRAHLAGIPIVDRRVCVGQLARRVNSADIDLWSYVLSAVPQTAWIRTVRRAKEITEPFIAMVLLIGLSPIMAAVAIAVKITSPGPVFYSQLRSGYLGKVFRLYKFRSMKVDCEEKGIQWAQRHDPRVTSVGRFIRKTRLDELPQLWNIVKREMGFIGPRPERPEIYRDLKTQIPLFFLRTNVRPGVTGWAQVCAGYSASVEESRVKLEYDLYYIQQMSFRLDLLIVLMTLKVILFGNEFIDRPSKIGEIHGKERSAV